MTMLQHGSVPSTGGYQIERSLRFNSADSAYLNRTPASAGNRKTWTWSGWVKKATNGITACMFGAGGSDGAVIRFETNDTIRCYDYSGSFSFNLQTTQVFRDPSAWYHVVLTFDSTQSTSSDRAKLYVNGSQITAFSSSTYPSLNQDAYFFNNNVLHRIGAVTFVNSNYLDGYLTEVYFIDGSAKTPSDFGENDTDTGVWKPKAYSGTYGTNGFYLKFADNSGTTATTLGKDSSGNGNNWTPNNFSVTAGAGNDSLVDTPTPYGTDTGVGGEVRGNYCTWNPLSIVANASLSNGNLDATNTSGSNYRTFVSTIAIPSGSWYCEFTAGANTSGDNMFVGICPASAALSSTYIGSSATSYAYSSNGTKYNNASATSYGASFTNGDVIGVAFNGSTLTFYKNGTTQGNAFTSLSGDFVFALSLWGTAVCTANFGQRPFAYTAPSGFKALCTTNLPTPAIGATSTTRADKYFNPTAYTGNGSSSRAITNGIDMSTNGGLVWTKQRSGVEWHFLIDSVRGNTKYLSSNATSTEGTISTLVTSFDSTGYSIGNDSGINSNGATYVGWAWGAGGTGVSNTQGSITSTVSANTTSGFSIVTWTATNGAATVGHGLGVAPSMIIVKDRTSVSDWAVYHASLGNTGGLALNTTAAFNTDSRWWNNTSPTSSVFSVALFSNYLTDAMVAYCFAPVAGYSAFGSYTGNGSADGTFVYTGFRPAFVLAKANKTGYIWTMSDSKRDTYNIVSKYLQPQASSAEGSSFPPYDFTSNGFKLRTTDGAWNESGTSYIYMAFAENPFKYSLAR
jgi:hypothetical protein